MFNKSCLLEITKIQLDKLHAMRSVNKQKLPTSKELEELKNLDNGLDVIKKLDDIRNRFSFFVQTNAEQLINAKNRTILDGDIKTIVKPYIGNSENVKNTISIKTIIEPYIENEDMGIIKNLQLMLNTSILNEFRRAIRLTGKDGRSIDFTNYIRLPGNLTFINPLLVKFYNPKLWKNGTHIFINSLTLADLSNDAIDETKAVEVAKVLNFLLPPENIIEMYNENKTYEASESIYKLILNSTIFKHVNIIGVFNLSNLCFQDYTYYDYTDASVDMELIYAVYNFNRDRIRNLDKIPYDNYKLEKVVMDNPDLFAFKFDLLNSVFNGTEIFALVLKDYPRLIIRPFRPFFYINKQDNRKIFYKALKEFFEIKAANQKLSEALKNEKRTHNLNLFINNTISN
ncbi:MAG: hypothetical protein ACP5LM_04755, partial [Thermoplasmata archaeon]